MSRTVVLALVFASTHVPALADSKADPIEVTVSALHAGGFEGVVAVTDRRRTLFERAVGLRDKARKIRHDVDQRWPWASVTKQVTALLIMRQIEAGRLSLDTKVRSVLPDFAGPTGDRVTIRDLLQHSSGLPNPADTPKDKQGVPAFYRETASQSPTPPAPELFAPARPRRNPAQASPTTIATTRCSGQCSSG
jgi:CubicO group peptidase (beta-lactamase class C family)